MSENLNLQTELTVDEMALIGAYRTGNVKALLDFAAGSIVATEPEISFTREVSELEEKPETEAFTKQRYKDYDVASDYMDSAERLALHIMGYLGLRGYWVRIVTQDDGLGAIYRDIAKAVKSGLPHLDTVELDHMSEDK